MPSKYRIREFAENEYYHAYNRGLQKQKIFFDDQDFNIFHYYLKIYLASPKDIIRKYPQLPIRLQVKNLNEQVELISYCLMPNHFHFLLKQSTKDAIPKLMKRIINAYTLYFNQKYRRTGPLFEGRYKAVHVASDELLLHISRYIHLNPVVSNLINSPESYQWSSCKSYTTGAGEEIISQKTVLSFFERKEDYRKFVKDQISYAKELEKIKHLAIDQD